MNAKKLANDNFTVTLEEWVQKSSQVGTWIQESANQLVCSPMFMEIHGLPGGLSVAWKDIGKLYSSDSLKIFQAAYADLLSEGHDLDVKVKLEKSGALLRLRGRPVFDENGKNILGYEGFIQDVSGKYLEKERILRLIQQNQLFESLLDMNNIIAHTDRSGKITYVNELFCQISQYSRDELLGQDHRILNSGYHSEHYFKNMWLTISSGNTWRGEVRNRAKDGSFYWVDTMIQPIFTSDYKEIKEYIAVRRDITKLIENSEAGVRTARLAAIGETTSQIIHDVLNPLTVIVSSAMRLKKFTLDDIGQEKYVRTVSKVEASSKKIFDIFDQMRAELQGRQKVAKISISQVIKESVAAIEDMLRVNSVELNLECDGDFIIDGSAIQLSRVFANLTKNSIEAVASLPEKWIRIIVKSVNDEIVIEFIDSGRGINPNIASKIFESLFSTKKSSGGTGLGLASCRNIIEACGGTIEVNQESENTQFDIKFKVPFT